MSLCRFIALVSVMTYVNMYGLRKFNSSFYNKCVDILINLKTMLGHNRTNQKSNRDVEQGLKIKFKT